MTITASALTQGQHTLYHVQCMLWHIVHQSCVFFQLAEEIKLVSVQRLHSASVTVCCE